jgi:hypothetical protein
MLAVGAALCTLLAGFGTPVSATQQVPFQASIAGTITVTATNSDGSPATAQYSGSGRATALGVTQLLPSPISFAAPTVACPGGAPGFSGVHHDTLAAANGNQLFLTITENSCLTTAAGNTLTFQCAGTFTITGGTGNLTGASGGGTWNGTVQITLGPAGFQGASGPFQTSYAGTISQP